MMERGFPLVRRKEMFILLLGYIRDVLTTQFRYSAGGERRCRVSPPSLVIGVFASFVLTGCGGVDSGFKTSEFKNPPPPVTCHSAQQCTVPVEVNCTASPCAITVQSQYLNMAANGFAVVWEIVAKPGQSYKFKNPGGIFLKTAAGQQAFHCDAEMNDAKFSCHGNRDSKTYEYGIELVGSPPVSKLDPWIVNK
jgi:hypothetical protein